MILRDIQFYLPITSPRGSFIAESYAISYHFLLCFPKLKTQDVGKLVIEPSQNKSEPKKLLDVVVVEEEFDFDKYDSETALGKKKLMLELLHNGCLKAATYYGWESDGFETAYQCVKAENYTLKRLWKKPKSSPNRKIKAQLEYEVDLQETYFRAIFFDPKGQVIGQQKLHQVKTGWIWIYEVFGDFKWLDNDTVALISRDGLHQWTAQVGN